MTVAARRTPVGSFQGRLAPLTAPQLGAVVIKALLEESGVDPTRVDEVILGMVLTAGQGQAPARQAALGAGLPESVECLTVNKMCASGLKAVMLASQAIQVGDADVVIAGGMESMSQAPYLLPKAREGYRLGHGPLVDSLIRDGLWDVYNDIHMGSCAELCARKKGYSRKDQDAVARESYRRAKKAQEAGWFRDEIVPIMVPQRKGAPLLVKEDEEPGRADFGKMGRLKPAFDKDGTITAANASKINDGAAALLLMAQEKAVQWGLEPLVTLGAQASTAQAPEWFTTAPGRAIAKVLKKAGLTRGQIDLWEINEAFAPVLMAALEEHELDPGKVNIHGGAIALGHPIGASGARVLTTLIHALHKEGASRGLATLCIGGGEASALVVERGE